MDPVPSGSGLAQRMVCNLDRHVLGVDAAHSRDPPSEDDGSAQHPLASAGPRVAQVSAHDPQAIDYV